MSEKTVILMNEADYAEKLEGHTKEKKLKVGKWNDEQQERFINSLYAFKSRSSDDCLCNFDVEYDHTCLCDIGLSDGVGCIINNWSDRFRKNRDTELVIVMKPELHEITENDPNCCKCGAKFSYQCPTNIKDGKCTAPSIKKLVGKVLFPDKYKKTR